MKTIVKSKPKRELPSPKGEGFKLRLKPVRVGLTADSPAPFSPREKGRG